MADDVCQVVCKDTDLIDQVTTQMEPPEKLHLMADLFKVLGDPTRIKILNALTHSELCVCELAEIMDMGSSAISHQLRVLRSAKIVKFRREGKNVVYSLDDTHIYGIMNQGMEHIQEGNG